MRFAPVSSTNVAFRSKEIMTWKYAERREKMEGVERPYTRRGKF